MTNHVASDHDQEKPRNQSRARYQGKAILLKKDTKKPSRPNTTKTSTEAIAEPLRNSPSTDNDDVQPRIAERAYELYHRRGGHHGQDLDDWLMAEQEFLSQEP